MSGPVFGLCPGSRDWLQESGGDPLTGQDWIRAPPNVPPNRDDTDFVMRRLALKKIDSFSGSGHGFFFWNFRTDLYQPQWSYMGTWTNLIYVAFSKYFSRKFDNIRIAYSRQNC
jgi:glucan 1,3-beta-glucosidase